MKPIDRARLIAAANGWCDGQLAAVDRARKLPSRNDRLAALARIGNDMPYAVRIIRDLMEALEQPQ